MGGSTDPPGERIPFRHAVPREVGRTLCAARLLLASLLATFAMRQACSFGDGVKAFIYADAHRSPAEGAASDAFEYLVWPAGWLLIAVVLFLCTIARLRGERRAIARLQTEPGAVVTGDGLELVVPCWRGVRPSYAPWAQVVRARSYRDPFAVPHVSIKLAGRWRWLRLGPYLERPEELIAEINARAGGGRGR